MAKRLARLNGEEISIVTRAANRRRFLLTKGETMDEIKALQAVEAIDKDGLGDAIEALASHDPAISADILAKSDLDEAGKAKLKAAMRVMGNDLATSLLVKAAAPETVECADCGKMIAKSAAFCPNCGSKVSDPEDATDGGSDENAEDAKGKKKGKKMAKSDEKPDELSDAVKALLQKAEDEKADLKTRLEKAEADTAKLAAEKRRARFIKLAGELKHLPPVVADDFAAVLDKTEAGLGEKDFGKLFTVLKSADAVAADSSLFKEFGSAQSGETQSAATQIESKAEELRKADPSLSPERARTKVLKANPALYRLWEAERAADIKKSQA